MYKERPLSDNYRHMFMQNRRQTKIKKTGASNNLSEV
jgi:hypothetical protein